MAGYYISLALMCFFLIGYTRRHQEGEDLRDELVRYRNCGVVFMVLNLTLATMTSFMIYWNKTFEHNEITTIAMATFNFGMLAISVVNMMKYRKYNSPVYSASKAIGLAAACVSMIVLESTMINTFDDATMSVMTGKILLVLTCAVVSAVIIGMASYMIIKGNERIRRLDSEVR